MILLFIGLMGATSLAEAQTPPVTVPNESLISADDANLALKKDLDQRYQALSKRFIRWNADATAFNNNYGGKNLDADTKEAKDGMAEQARLSQALQDYQHDADQFKGDVSKLRLREIDHDSSGQIIHTVVDLAKDPELTTVSRLQLELINDQIARITNAIYILSDSNPEWHKEWETLKQEQEEATQHAILVGLDIASDDLAKSFELGSEAQLEKAQEVFESSNFKELMEWRDSLKSVGASFGNTPDMAQNINSLNLLETAVKIHDTAKAVALFREVVFNTKELYDSVRHAGLSAKASDQLFHGSMAMGGVAVALVDGIGGKVAAPVGLALKAGELGFTFQLIHEENQQFDALSNQSYKRNQKKLELMKKQVELEAQAGNLKMVMQRSEGMK